MKNWLIFYLVPLMNAGRKFFRTVASKTIDNLARPS